jgi:hypothetical protein
MADLSFIAAGVEEDELWTRKGRRSTEPNPFEDLLRQSWDERREVGTGQNKKVRGTTYGVNVQSYDSYKQVKNALARAIRDLEEDGLRVGVTIAAFGPPNEDDMRTLLDSDALKTEEGWNKNSGGDVRVKFAAKPKRRVVEDE